MLRTDSTTNRPAQADLHNSLALARVPRSCAIRDRLKTLGKLSVGVPILQQSWPPRRDRGGVAPDFMTEGAGIDAKPRGLCSPLWAGHAQPRSTRISVLLRNRSIARSRRSRPAMTTPTLAARRNPDP